MLIGRYGVIAKGEVKSSDWTQNDVVLITYADMIQQTDEAPLATLKKFCDIYLRGAISAVHLLPFYPYSSDGGFSVIDYRQVDPANGNWYDVAKLRQDYDLMFDLVLNHCSRESKWFKDYLDGIAPEKDYICEGNPDDDLSEVVRPRPSALLTPTETANGLRYVWNTFSKDQVDLNWKNPDVLFEFLDILLYYISEGAKIVRLDAVGFLWKEVGTSCIHLRQTHEMIKLMRDLVDMVAPEVILLTETNVPHQENISYFGKGDEAHMVYQFALPPLLVHGFLKNDSTYLQNWLNNLEDPPEGCTFFNFTASHDGVGLRPITGLVPDEDVHWMVEETRKRNGRVGMRAMPDGSEQPYELNITYFDALSDPDNEIFSFKRFLCSQAIALSLKGIPGIYFHSFVGEKNWLEGAETLTNRDINRRRWDYDDLCERLEDHSSRESAVNMLYTSILRARKSRRAFHPEGSQEVFDTPKDTFALLRKSPTGTDRILCLFNFSDQPQTFDQLWVDAKMDFLATRNIITGKLIKYENEKLTLEPYGFIWLGWT